jgi:hypothetical protein
VPVNEPDTSDLPAPDPEKIRSALRRHNPEFVNAQNKFQWKSLLAECRRRLDDPTTHTAA